MKSRNIAIIITTPLVAVPLAAGAVAATPSPTTPKAVSTASTAAAFTVGSHVAGVLGIDTLGSPVAAETSWGAGGTGWAQKFEKGWAFRQTRTKGGASAGQGGVVLDFTPVSDYFWGGHPTVKGIDMVGYPVGESVSVNGGTYENFTSGSGSLHGIIASSPAGTFAVTGALHTQYLAAGGPEGSLGYPTGAAVKDASGRLTQQFTGGTLGGGQQTPTPTSSTSTTSPATPSPSTSTPTSSASSTTPTTPAPTSTDVPTATPTSPSIPTSPSAPTSTTATATSTSPTSSPTSLPAWKPDAKYVQPVTGPIVSGPGRVMTYGMNGIKVYWAQQALGIEHSPNNSVLGPITQDKLKAFQKAHSLRVTGAIDPATWAKLQAGQSWDIDGWKQPSLVSTTASRTERVNAAIAWAKTQIGKPYIWGGTGPTGYDCSGLMIQIMRAGGVDPKNVSNSIDTSTASDLSWRMYLDPEFQKGDPKNLQIGDFVYSGDSIRVRHVVMYIGGGQYLQAVGDKVTITGNVAWSKVWGVNRAFAL